MPKTRLSSLYPLLLCLLVTIVCLLLFPRYAYNDPDTFWHLELGRYMLSHGTVLHHAIYTYAGEALPYVPHEYAFQLLLALLVQTFGWPGAYLLTAACLLLLIAGMVRLMRVSRSERGLDPTVHPMLLLFVMLIVSWVYYAFFATRPQMVSAWMIVWFVAFLREFRLRPGLRPAAAMTLLSLAVANFHAGVWLVMAVFTCMAAFEAGLERSFDRRRAAALLLVLLAGLANPGGARSLLFILTVTKDDTNLLINEWQPIAFGQLDNAPLLLALLLFAVLLPFSLHRMPFRFLFMLGILYLGVSSYKQNLFLWLFLPYFAATAFESVPARFTRRFAFPLRMRRLLLAVCAGLAANVAIVFASPPRVDAKQYPVAEMDYILSRASEGIRPKVMAPYGASGYVLYRGGDVLCDGRQDPFITDDSKGPLGWNAFQRSMYGYGEYLPDVVREDRPDYVIVRSGVSWKLQQEWNRTFGEPVFKGSFGIVYAIR